MMLVPNRQELRLLYQQQRISERPQLVRLFPNGVGAEGERGRPNEQRQPKNDYV